MPGTRIGIVEDNPIISELLFRTLTGLSYNVVHRSKNGEIGIIEAVRKKPDIVLMDIELGGVIDGIDAADYLFHVFGIPVIFVTSHYEESTIERAKMSGTFGYILKPFTDKSLLASIEIALQSAKNPAIGSLRDDIGRLLDSPDPIVVTTARGFILYANRPYEALSGMSLEHALMKPVSAVHELRDYQGATAFPQTFFESLENHHQSSGNPVISFSKPFFHGERNITVPYHARMYPVWKSGGILAVIIRLNQWQDLTGGGIINV